MLTRPLLEKGFSGPAVLLNALNGSGFLAVAPDLEGGGGKCTLALGAGGRSPLDTLKYAELRCAWGSSPPGVAGAKPGFFGTRVVLDLGIPGESA